MIRQKTTTLLALTMAIMVTGCALSTFRARTGTGDSTAHRAILLTENDAAISRIDGKTVFVTSRNWWVPIVTKTRASVIPGEHTLVLNYAKTGWSGTGIETTLTAEPGKTYIVRAQRLKSDPIGEMLVFTAEKKPQIAKIKVWIEVLESDESALIHSPLRAAYSAHSDYSGFHMFGDLFDSNGDAALRLSP